MVHYKNTWKTPTIVSPAIVCMLVSEIAKSVELFSIEIARCIAGRRLEGGEILHGRFIKTSFILNTFLANRLAHLYAKCGRIAAAEAVFSETPFKNAHSWNTIVSSFSTIGRFDSSLEFLLKSPHQSEISFNSLISGLARRGLHRRALQIFRKMLSSDAKRVIQADKFTIVAVAGACGGALDLVSLRQVHGAIVSRGVDLDLVTINAMIDAYGKCGQAEMAWLLFQRMISRDVVSWTSMVSAFSSSTRLDEARLLFAAMPLKNAVSWATLIAGYSKNGQGDEALKLLPAMIEQGVSPNPFALVSALRACACEGAIGRGREIHGYVSRRGDLSQNNIFLENSLMGMYAKCGEVACAEKLFERMRKRDVVSWNTMVTGFAVNGDGGRALAFLKEMIETGLAPNDVTFLSALSACSHGGFFDEARQLLLLMKKLGLSPSPVHCAAVVDLLGRKSGLKETKEALFQLDSWTGARYVTLSNVFAAARCWDEAGELRKIMKEKGLRKDVARSWIETIPRR
ncbi:pentatricopeptide repeat-containing protein At1g25360-like isoform X2 [Wolffia australiana]